MGLRSIWIYPKFRVAEEDAGVRTDAVLFVKMAYKW
jgi:hypothetical protein